MSEQNLKVIIERCPRNHKCPAMQTCPVEALTQEGFNAPTVDLSKCIKCGICTNRCPKNALVLE